MAKSEKLTLSLEPVERATLAAWAKEEANLVRRGPQMALRAGGAARQEIA